MNKLIAALVLSLLLSGCSTVWYAAKETIAEEGANAADEELIVFAWGICRQATVGSIDRRFDTPERRTIRDDFCAVFYP